MINQYLLEPCFIGSLICIIGRKKIGYEGKFQLSKWSTSLTGGTNVLTATMIKYIQDAKVSNESMTTDLVSTVIEC